MVLLCHGHDEENDDKDDDDVVILTCHLQAWHQAIMVIVKPWLQLSSYLEWC